MASSAGFGFNSIEADFHLSQVQPALAVGVCFLGTGFQAVVANPEVFILDRNPLHNSGVAEQFQVARYDAGVSLRVMREPLNTHAPAAMQGGEDFQAVDLADDAEQRRQVAKGGVSETLLAWSGGSV